MINNLFDLRVVKREYLRGADARCFHIGKKEAWNLVRPDIVVLVYQRVKDNN